MDYLIEIIMIAVFVYFIGHSFIDTFFEKKEEMINRMMNQEEGE